MTDPIQPPGMSLAAMLTYAVSLPAGLLLLVFWPAGSIAWLPGWIFVIVMAAALSLSALWIAKANPVIYRARSRIQPGTERWDRRLLAVLLPLVALSIPVATFDAGRAHWSQVPGWVILIGYALILAGVAGTAWAQVVNPFFEPGVRLQTERGQHVIDGGPYRIVRHPGYLFGLMIFIGMPLALGSYWGLVPTALGTVLLLVRTAREDRLLQENLAGYSDYARRVRYRILPRVW